MKQSLLMVLISILLAACGSLSDSKPATAVQAQVRIAPIAPGDGVGNPITPVDPPEVCPIPCCNNSVTFMCLYGVSIAPAGPSVSVNSSLIVAFREPQDPAHIALSVLPEVNCSWVWAEDFKQATCTPQGRFAIVSGLSYATTYTVSVERWVGFGGRLRGFWTEWLSSSFITEAQPVLVAQE